MGAQLGFGDGAGGIQGAVWGFVGSVCPGDGHALSHELCAAVNTL